MPWTRDDADHLLRRAGFGGSLGDVDRIFALGQAGAINAMVNYESTPDPTWSNNAVFSTDTALDQYGLRINLLYQMYTSDRPLHTKMLWFWHNHFTTSFQACEFVDFRVQMSLYRDNAMGNFGTFLNSVYKNAAMLFYLNGNGSNRSGPNQNFARECMELFTIGTGPFTETDVKEAARAFTGWYVLSPPTRVLFDWNQWDNGPKTILGQTAAFNGDSLVAMLAARPETAQRLTKKLYSFFVNETVNVVDQANLAATWTASNGDVRTVMNTLVAAPSFWDPVNRWNLMKTPIDLAFGLMQRFEIVPDRAMMVSTLNGINAMGYAMFDPVNVAGYRQPTMLTGSTNLLSRFQFAAKVIIDWASDTTIARFSAGLVAPVAPGTLITQVAARMGSMPLAANTMTVIQSYLGPTAIAAADLPQRTRDVAFLIACSAEYQLM